MLDFQAYAIIRYIIFRSAQLKIWETLRTIRPYKSFVLVHPRSIVFIPPPLSCFTRLLLASFVGLQLINMQLFKWKPSKNIRMKNLAFSKGIMQQNEETFYKSVRWRKTTRPGSNALFPKNLPSLWQHYSKVCRRSIFGKKASRMLAWLQNVCSMFQHEVRPSGTSYFMGKILPRAEFRLRAMFFAFRCRLSYRAAERKARNRELNTLFQSLWNLPAMIATGSGPGADRSRRRNRLRASI